MSSFAIFLAENFILFLSAAVALSTLLFAVGLLGAWRTGRRLGRTPRPLVRFGLSLICLAAGLAGVLLFSDGLRTVVPAVGAQNRMLGHPAPALDFTYVEDQNPGSLADFHGQVVLVNFWATWCPPCREEMPDLDEIQGTYGPDGLVVLQISDEDRDTVSQYLDTHPMSTIHGLAEPIPWPEFGRPTTFVVDREGIVRRAISGARDLEGFERELEGYL